MLWFYARTYGYRRTRCRETTGAVALVAAAIQGGFAAARRGVIQRSDEHGISSALARSWPTGSMVLWVGVFLALMLIAGVITSLNR